MLSILQVPRIWRSAMNFLKLAAEGLLPSGKRMSTVPNPGPRCKKKWLMKAIEESLKRILIIRVPGLHACSRNPIQRSVIGVSTDEVVNLGQNKGVHEPSGSLKIRPT
jgi:hypothetical protein